MEVEPPVESPWPITRVPPSSPAPSGYLYGDYKSDFLPSGSLEIPEPTARPTEIQGVEVKPAPKKKVIQVKVDTKVEDEEEDKTDFEVPILSRADYKVYERVQRRKEQEYAKMLEMTTKLEKSARRKPAPEEKRWEPRPVKTKVSKEVLLKEEEVRKDADPKRLEKSDRNPRTSDAECAEPWPWPRPEQMIKLSVRKERVLSERAEERNRNPLDRISKGFQVSHVGSNTDLAGQMRSDKVPMKVEKAIDFDVAVKGTGDCEGMPLRDGGGITARAIWEEACHAATKKIGPKDDPTLEGEGGNVFDFKKYYTPFRISTAGGSFSRYLASLGRRINSVSEQPGKKVTVVGLESNKKGKLLDPNAKRETKTSPKKWGFAKMAVMGRQPEAVKTALKAKEKTSSTHVLVKGKTVPVVEILKQTLLVRVPVGESLVECIEGQEAEIHELEISRGKRLWNKLKNAHNLAKDFVRMKSNSEAEDTKTSVCGNGQCNIEQIQRWSSAVVLADGGILEVSSDEDDVSFCRKRPRQSRHGSTGTLNFKAAARAIMLMSRSPHRSLKNPGNLLKQGENGVVAETRNPVPYLSFVQNVSLTDRGARTETEVIERDVIEHAGPCGRFVSHMHMRNVSLGPVRRKVKTVKAKKPQPPKVSDPHKDRPRVRVSYPPWPPKRSKAKRVVIPSSSDTTQQPAPPPPTPPRSASAELPLQLPFREPSPDPDEDMGYRSGEQEEEAVDKGLYDLGPYVSTERVDAAFVQEMRNVAVKQKPAVSYSMCEPPKGGGIAKRGRNPRTLPPLESSRKPEVTKSKKRGGEKQKKVTVTKKMDDVIVQIPQESASHRKKAGDDELLEAPLLPTVKLDDAMKQGLTVKRDTEGSLQEQGQVELAEKKKKKARTWTKGTSKKGNLKDNTKQGQLKKRPNQTTKIRKKGEQEDSVLKAVDLDLNLADAASSDSKEYASTDVTDNCRLKLQNPVVDKDPPGDQDTKKPKKPRAPVVKKTKVVKAKAIPVEEPPKSLTPQFEQRKKVSWIFDDEDFSSEGENAAMLKLKEVHAPILPDAPVFDSDEDKDNESEIMEKLPDEPKVPTPPPKTPTPPRTPSPTQKEDEDDEAYKKRWGPRVRDTSLEDERERQRIAEERRRKAALLFERLRGKKYKDGEEDQDDDDDEGINFDEYDFLAKYCIFNKGNLEMYKKTFDVVDEDDDGMLDFEETLMGLKGINRGLSDSEQEYIYRVLEHVGYKITDGADLKLFSVVCALSQKINALDSWMRNLIGRIDFKMLDMKMFMCKTLWECNVDPETNTIPIDQLCVELRAGGVSIQHERQVREKLQHLHALDLLDFLTYIPLFIMIHTSVVDNPLDDTRDK
ncbi:uncharacterized protein LOC135487718 [Lineus longissimus]|uniref:uncharacterized protein LOC135487718 n=1 Tax=Lineus longissimus TaxID=88925 RepID=UPI00315E01BB